ncbi:protocatechuate 4,5-dioxygenase subunit alpha [Gammaproteobacteria bacterium]|nr:protocatechuate 4,5-dioxygenase subunit alpha [Gammaproteobacteria bacterium]
MPSIQNNNSDIPGTIVFDGKMAVKGYALNKMCYSFNSAENRKKFKAFPEEYCRAFNLTEEQTHAVTDLDVLRMLKAGGNIYYLAKLTGIYGFSVQEIGAQQTNRSLEEFKEMLAEHGKTH